MMGGSDGIAVLEAYEQLDWMLDRMQRMRLPLEDEKALQAVIAERLTAYGVAFEREVALAAAGVPLGVIDFFVPVIGAGIEVKIKGTQADIRRQLARYAGDERLHRLVLVTSKPVSVPITVGRRFVPVHVVDIARGWL